MQLLLIKIGKAWNVLKREGLWRGGRRVFIAFLSLFRRVSPGDIFFISNGVGDSARYRTVHAAEALTFRGFKTAITIQDNPFLVSYADKFSVFVFHRVLYTEKVAQFIERIKSLGREIIFDTDDLIHDPAFLKHMDYFTRMNSLERKLYENGVGGEILADPYLKVCTVSTSFLAEKLREKGKQVFVVRNRLSAEDVQQAEKILPAVRKDPSLVRVAYLSGTPSHNKDFATITDALLKVFETYKEMRLVLVGPLDTDDALRRFSDRIEQLSFMPRAEYFATVATLDINLAPLEIGNPFCEAKSELKWFEAGLFGVPTVASDTGTFREAITEGRDGYTANTTEEWAEKIGALIADAGLRKEIGKKARASVLARYTTANADDDEYYNYLRSKII